MFVRSLQGRPLLLSVPGYFSVLVTNLCSCLVHVIYNSNSIVTINSLHDKAVYDLNYSQCHEDICRSRARIQAYTYCKTPLRTTQFKQLQATRFDFSSKPSSHLSNIKSHTRSLHLHVASRSHFLTTVIKTYIKIHTSCVKLKNEYKNCSFKYKW
jgi:hypothetical protein